MQTCQQLTNLHKYGDSKKRIQDSKEEIHRNALPFSAEGVKPQRDRSLSHSDDQTRPELSPSGSLWGGELIRSDLRDMCNCDQWPEKVSKKKEEKEKAEEEHRSADEGVVMVWFPKVTLLQARHSRAHEEDLVIVHPRSRGRCGLGSKGYPSTCTQPTST